MTKQQFLKELKRKLRKLKKAERDRYIEYYDEMISDIVESGVAEAAAIEKQGSVDQIAGDILANTNPMNLRSGDWRGAVLAGMSGVMLLLSLLALLFQMQFHMSMSTAVGIIGGADGPTSIFVAGNIGAPWGLYLATAVVVIVTAVYFVKVRRKK